MTAISRLVVILGADSAQFITELANADRAAKGFAGNTISNLKRVAGSLAGLVSVGAMVAFTKQAAAAADQLADTAHKLGVATDQLAGFQLAAKLAGVSNEALEKSLGMAARRLAEFNMAGTGAAGDWLKKLGLDTQELARLAPDQLFLKYADAIGGLNSQGERLAAVSALMGDRTGEMLKLIQGGSGALTEAIQKAKDYGVALNDIEATQIQLATDAIDEAKFALQGLGTQVALAAAPFVELMVTGFNESARSVGGFKEAIHDAMLFAAQAMGIASNAGIALNTVMDEVALQGMKVHLAGLEISKIGKEIGAQAPGFLGENARKELARVVTDMEATEVRIGELEGQISERLLGIVSAEDVKAMFDSIIAANVAKAEAQFAALNLAGGGGDDGGAGGMSEADQKALDAMRERLAEEEVLKLAQYEKDREFVERTVTDKAEMYELLRELDLEYFDWKRERDIENEEFYVEQQLREAEAYEAEFAKEKIVRDKADELAKKDFAAFQKFQVDQRKNTFNLTLGLLHALAGESKSAAIAAIALEKGMAIARVIISTHTGVMKAVEQLGIYAAPAVAGIIALGAAQVALIAATGIAQAGSIGGGGAALGTAANPTFTQPSGGGETFTEQGGPVEPVVIVITGNGSGFDPNDQDAVLGYVREQVNENDQLLFGDNSRQMAQIRQALGRR